jgi:acetyl-CoA carboxylase carboxyl transferase subunit beta
MDQRLSWQERLLLTADADSFTEFDSGLDTLNPIGYPGYEEKIATLQQETGIREAIVTGRCTIEGEKALIGIMDSRFMMASMGSVVGEKVTRLFEYGAEHKLPVILFTASGGARMQEGTVALMQMAKTAGAAALFSRAGQIYIAVLCDPTTGGVQASFASLGDITLAEPGAVVGFAGKRVIRDTIGHSLPLHFQTSEFIMEHGFADMVVPREELRPLLARLIRFHRLSPQDMQHSAALRAERPAVRETSGGTAETAGYTGQKLSVVQKLERLRTVSRPGAQDYMPHLFDDFTELHGDRCYGDDPAVLGGLALFQGRPVTVIAQPRGVDIEDLKRINFSMSHPEGYRKALRLARQAEKFRRPVICLIDTPGAYCGVEAEERSQGDAIARNLAAFMELQTVVVSVVLGEGGSGGALALGTGDELAMLENALYSVINPRGFASILWKDPGREKEAAELMKITAEDLKAKGICDAVIAEADTAERTADNIRRYLSGALARLCAGDPAALPAKRYSRFRAMGEFTERP